MHSVNINNKDEGYSEIALVAYARPWVQSPVPPKNCWLVFVPQCNYYYSFSLCELVF